MLSWEQHHIWQKSNRLFHARAGKDSAVGTAVKDIRLLHAWNVDEYAMSAGCSMCAETGG